MQERGQAAPYLVAVKSFAKPGETEMKQIFMEAMIMNQIKHEHVVAIVSCA